MHNISRHSNRGKWSGVLNTEAPRVVAINAEKTSPRLTDYTTDHSWQSAKSCEADSLLNDRYEVQQLLGSGGMGRVFHAIDRQENKPCAVKFMHAHLSENDIDVRRFEQEASITKSLKHKNIVDVYDAGYTMDRNPFIVMEYIDGKSLANMIQSARLELPEFFSIFEQICEGVNFARTHSVTHRDIKPSNIMICDINGALAAKLVDFGIAKRCTQTGQINPTLTEILAGTSGSLSAIDDDTLQHLTQPGEIFGSPLYMSPEQCRGEGADCRSEVYTLGCMMFEALTGITPLKGGSSIETLMIRRHEFAPSLNEAVPGLRFPSAVTSLVARALEHDPNDRHENVAVLLSELQKVRILQATVPTNRLGEIQLVLSENI